MDKTLKAFLKTLAPFDEDELLEAGQWFTYEAIKNGHYFLKAGHYCDRIGYIKSGLLRSYFVADNKETTTFFATPGTVAGDLHGFLKRTLSTETCQALEDSEILYIKHKDLYSLYKENWKWQQVGRVLMETYYIASEERTLMLQSKTAHELYEYFVRQHPNVIRSASLSYIASYLGITPETLSRIRNRK